MKKENCKPSEVINDQYSILDQNDAKSLLSGYDREIKRLNELSLMAPDEKSSEDIKQRCEYLQREKGIILKASKSIIRSALRGTNKWIHMCYPALLNWDEADRVYQLQTTRPFDIDLIEYLAKDIKSVQCKCRDGEERVFEIKKVEAFYGRRRSKNRKIKKCVNVYF